MHILNQCDIVKSQAEGVERTFATNALAPFQLMVTCAQTLLAHAFLTQKCRVWEKVECAPH